MKTIQNNSLQQMLDDDIGRFISAERQLYLALPLWAEQTKTLSLKLLLQDYEYHIKEHIDRLKIVALEEPNGSFSNSPLVMQAYIDETDAKLAHCTNGLYDACLLAAVQGINHYKISAYGTAASWAKVLNMTEAASIFYELETNEKETDKRLSVMAINQINRNAGALFALH